MAPIKIHDASISINDFSFILHMDGVSLTFAFLELPLHEAELFFGPPQALPQSGDLRSGGSGGQQRRLLIHIDII